MDGKVSRVTVPLRVWPASVARVDALAAVRGWSRSQMLRHLLAEGLDAVEAEDGVGVRVNTSAASVAPVASSASRIGLPSRPTVEELRARVASVPASPVRRPVERALPEGWLRDARGVAQWVGSTDAEGNPLLEDPA